MSKSQVSQLRNQIEAELAAMRQGLSGLAAGTAKHQFIESKLRLVGTFEDQLARYIGGEQAVQFSCQAYIRVMEGEYPVKSPILGGEKNA